MRKSSDSSVLSLVSYSVQLVLCGNPLEEYLINISFNYNTYEYSTIKIYFILQQSKITEKLQENRTVIFPEPYENKLPFWFPILP